MQNIKEIPLSTKYKLAKKGKLLSGDAVELKAAKTFGLRKARKTLAETLGVTTSLIGYAFKGKSPSTLYLINEFLDGNLPIEKIKSCDFKHNGKKISE